MLGPLTYLATTALTRERLASIEQMLLGKISSKQNVTALERQVLFLASSARAALSNAPHLPSERSLPPFARELSLHAVVGSGWPTISQFAALYAQNQQWLYSTLQAGNPDPNRQRVMAGSTALLLKLAERGAARINASDVADKSAELLKLRALVLGYTCHVATDIVSAPFVNAVTWRLGDSTSGPLTLEMVVGSIEAASANLFQRDRQLSQSLSLDGALYRDWWLKPQDLPREFFDAMNEAIEATYGPGARAVLRPSTGGVGLPPQVSAAFWQELQAHRPPDLSVHLLQDGYASFRSAMETTYVWSFGDWVAATGLIFLPPIATYPLIVAMPHTRALFKTNATVDGAPVNTELGWFGLLVAPLITSALAPIVLSVYIAAGTSFGVSSETVFGWVTGGIDFVTSIISLASIFGDVSPTVRWLLLFVAPVLGLLIHAIYVLARGRSTPRRTQLALSSLLPLCIAAVYVLFHVAWHQSQDLGMNGFLKGQDGHIEGWGNAGYIGGWVLWTALLVGAWLLVSYFLRTVPEANAFVSGQKHFLRLFGQSSLFVDASVAADPSAEARNPGLTSQYFPTARRPLINVWWEGGGDLWMRSDRNALVFSTSEDGTANPQTVLAPAAPMNAAEFAHFLNQAVKEGDNFTRKLKAELVDPSDFDYVLPPGDVFADAGDEKTTQADHDTEAAKFTKLKTTHADASVVYHAPRAHLAGFQGMRGPVFVDFDRQAPVNGAGTITLDTTSTVAGDANTRFTTFFHSGDVVETTGVAVGNEARIVASVQDDRTLTITMAFSAAVSGTQSYRRAANTRDVDTPAGTLVGTAQFRVYQGTGFDSMFQPGDVVRVTPSSGEAEERVVVQVNSATQITVDKPFAVAIPEQQPPAPAVPCVRVGRAGREGFKYAPTSPVGIFAGDSLMERAADLGAILCMGAASQMLSASERQAVSTGPDEQRRPAVNPVFQVFRNWNLGQRRVNEWQMLIGGGAVSEKRGDPRHADPLQVGAPTGFTSPTGTGEDVANQLGWVPLLERWLDVARRPGINSLATESFRESDPTNRQLSEAVAFLFDLPMPA